MGCGLVDNSPFLRVAHSAHSPDDGVGIFSIVKWVLFQLSQFRRNRPSGYFLDCQMGTFSFDKHIETTMRPISPGRISCNILIPDRVSTSKKNRS